MPIKMDLVVFVPFFLGDKWTAKSKFAQIPSRRAVVLTLVLRGLPDKYSRLPEWIIEVGMTKGKFPSMR